VRHRSGAMRRPGPIAVPVAPGVEWWRGATVYQIYPRSFADSNGDGIGDLPGITAHLEHVASLGVEAIWLSPFYRSPMKDFGYDISDFHDVDPIFGTLADFDRLVMRAHELGLKVIVDQVYAHTSDQHPWFQESRSNRDNARADWFVWENAKDDGSPPSNWQSVFGGSAWAWDARRCQYYLHNFLTEQPALNVHRRDVQDALLDCARFWLDRGVDGFRLDAIAYAMHDPLLRDNPPAAATRLRTRSIDFQQPIYNKSRPEVIGFIERIRALTNTYGEVFTVAEVGGEDCEHDMKQYTAGPSRFNTAYGFNFLYANTLTPALVRNALEAWPEGPDASWPSWAFSNHDAPRAISRWSSAEDLARCAQLSMLLLVSLRGNLFLYQGEELGLPQAAIGFSELQDPEAIANWPLTLGRDGARTPMPWRAEELHAGFTTGRPWLPVGDGHARLAVDVQGRDRQSQLAITQRLLALRNGSTALRTGGLNVLEATDSVLAFERTAPGERLLCVFNLGPGDINWQSPPSGAWRAQQQVGGATCFRLPRLSGVIAVPAG
jgi:alpha-glucosidase